MVTLSPERALGDEEEAPGSGQEGRTDRDHTATTRRISSQPTRRYGTPKKADDGYWVRGGDTISARQLFEETDEEPDTLVQEPPTTPEPRIPAPRERVLTPAPALFEDSGLFRI